jgi:hypothetical protein
MWSILRNPERPAIKVSASALQNARDRLRSNKENLPFHSGKVTPSLFRYECPSDTPFDPNNWN